MMQKAYPLPLELREIIWEACIEPTSQEIYFYNDEDFGPEPPCVSDDRPGGLARFKVVIDYPVILHVCRESRQLAWKRHRISFQRFPQTSVYGYGGQNDRYALLPCRSYRPETDIFLITADDISLLWERSFRECNDPGRVFWSIRHLALGSWQLMDRDVIEFWQSFLCTLPALRHVSVIFGHFWGLECSSGRYGWHKFRHFNLIPLTEEVAGLYPDSTEEMVEDIPELAPRVVRDFIEELDGQLSTAEVLDEDNAPWDKESGRWLFRFGAKKMVIADA